MTWLRLQADFFQDPKIIRLARSTGPYGPLVFIAILTIAKRGGRDAEGAFDPGDLDPGVLASYMHVPASESDVSRGVTACHEVGLLVSRDDGKVALRAWKKYQPDATAIDRKRRQREKAKAKPKSSGSGSPTTKKPEKSRGVTAGHRDRTLTRRDERDTTEDLRSSSVVRSSKAGSASAVGTPAEPAACAEVAALAKAFTAPGPRVTSQELQARGMALRAAGRTEDADLIEVQAAQVQAKQAARAASNGKEDA